MSHLRVVRAEGPKAPRARRHQLTDDEVKRLRVATRNLIRAYGSAECLAEVSGVALDTLYGIGNMRFGRPGMATAVKIAKSAGVTAEQLLSGKLALADRCPTCGAERRVA